MKLRGVKCNFTKQPVDQHRLINLYNLHVLLIYMSVACLLLTGRCWIGLGSNLTGVEFSGSAGALSDYGLSWGH